MKIIYNDIIPFPGFIAMNIFGILFVRNDKRHKLTPRVINHESIHTEQMKEMLYIFFYLWYGVEWLVRLVIATKTAYRGISLEQEAYANENDEAYLKTRKRYAWIDYLKKPYKNGIS